MARIPKARFPSGQAWDYFTNVRKLLIDSHANVMNTFEKQIAPKARIDSYTADDELFNITVILDTLRKETFEYFFTERNIEGTVSRYVDSVKNFATVQFNRQYQAVVGVDPIGRDTKLQGIVQAANKENVSYIQSIPSKYHDNVETVILQGVRRGRSIDQIAEDLQGVYETNRNKAKFIARDQTGSLMGDITKARYQSHGLENFIWSTAGDDAVRNTHKMYNGIKFKWSEGAGPNGLIPGQDFGCRCTAEIDEEELLNL